MSTYINVDENHGAEPLVASRSDAMGSETCDSILRRKKNLNVLLILDVLCSMALWGALLGSKVLLHHKHGLYDSKTSSLDVLSVDTAFGLFSIVAVVMSYYGTNSDETIVLERQQRRARSVSNEHSPGKEEMNCDCGGGNECDDDDCDECHTLNRAFVAGWYLSILAGLTQIAKFWVYRGWGQNDSLADTLVFVICLLNAFVRMTLFHKQTALIRPRTTSGEEEKKITWSSVKRILKPYIVPRGLKNKVLVILTWVVLLVGKAAGIVAPLILGKIVSRLSQNPPEKVYDLVAVYAALNLAPKILSEIQDVLYVKVWQTAYAEVADTTFRHVHSLSLQWHLHKKMGNVIRAMDRGMEATDSIMYYAMIFLLPAVGTAVASFIVFIVHFNTPEIAAICFMGFCFYAWVTYVVTVWRTKFRESMNTHDNDMHEKTTDSLINFETVKYFANEEHEAQRYLSSVKEYQKGNYESQASVSLLNVSQATAIQLSMMFSLMLATYYILDGREGFGPGDFVAIQAYVFTIFEPLSFLGVIYASIINGLVDIQNISVLLGQVPDIVDSPFATPLVIEQAKGCEVEFRHVKFHYPGQEGGIDDLSFKIPAGTTTAIVGTTGSGKTTVSRLLFRFYDLMAGQILINQQDAHMVTQESLRQAIGIVPQDTVMFNETLKYNVRYGRLDATDREVEEVCEQAQVSQFVQRMEKKYDTVVGERGLKLSGGEKQRLSIARCLLKNPPIVVLDEATSALDNKTEKEIQAALNLLSGRTTLVIAHRLTTVQSADQIIVMKDGSIVEKGAHSDLLARKGAYHDLWTAQMKDVKKQEDSSSS